MKKPQNTKKKKNTKKGFSCHSTREKKKRNHRKEKWPTPQLKSSFTLPHPHRQLFPCPANPSVKKKKQRNKQLQSARPQKVVFPGGLSERILEGFQNGTGFENKARSRTNGGWLMGVGAWPPLCVPVGVLFLLLSLERLVKTNVPGTRTLEDKS